MTSTMASTNEIDYVQQPMVTGEYTVNLHDGIFPPTKHLLSRQLDWCKKGPWLFRVHSRDNPLSVYDNTDPVGLRPLSDEEKLKLANSVDYERLDDPVLNAGSVAQYQERIQQDAASSEPQQQGQDFVQEFTQDYTDPIHLWALKKGGVDYWCNNHVCSQSLTNQITEERSERSGRERLVLSRYQDKWLKKQRDCASVRDHFREIYQVNSFSSQYTPIPFPESANFTEPSPTDRPMVTIDADELDFSVRLPEKIFETPPTALPRITDETEADKKRRYGERARGPPFRKLNPEWTQGYLSPQAMLTLSYTNIEERTGAERRRRAIQAAALVRARELRGDEAYQPPRSASRGPINKLPVKRYVADPHGMQPPLWQPRPETRQSFGANHNDRLHAHPATAIKQEERDETGENAPSGSFESVYQSYFADAIDNDSSETKNENSENASPRLPALLDSENSEAFLI